MITRYGDHKGACEMIFSYGFLDATVQSAKELFLDLQVSEDDPLGLAKLRVSTVAPGVKLTCKGGSVEWHSDFVWLVCINEEDGLAFQVLQTNDGGRELRSTWKNTELRDTSILRELLAQDPLWEVYQLRAVVLIQQRVAEQLQLLSETSNVESFEYGDDKAIRKGPRNLALRLRELESKLLERSYGRLEEQVR